MRVAAEQVADAYLAQEAAKKIAASRNLPLAGATNYYASSPCEELADAALMFMHLMFCWECDNPAPRGKYWTCICENGMPVLADLAEVPKG